MRQLLQNNNSWIYIIYGIVSVILNSITIFFIIQIQLRYGGDLIALRFNIYEGVTVIDSAIYIWQYGVYAFIISIMNGICIWYLETRFMTMQLRYILVYWVFGSTILATSLFGYYLWLVIRINT